MGEKTAPQDSQIDLQLRLEQAQAFSDIIGVTLDASGRRRHTNSLETTIRLKGADVVFKARSDESGDDESAQVSFVVRTLENEHADRGENRGRIAVFRSSPDGIVRDLSVYDDSHSMMPGTSRAFAEHMPDIKEQPVEADMGTKLLAFMRNPMLSKALIVELVATTREEDEEVLAEKAERLKEINERSRNSMRETYLLNELVRMGVIPFIPGPLEPQEDVKQLLRKRFGFEGETLLDD